MQDSRPGFAIQREHVSKPRLQFCGEECKSFSGPPQDFALLHKPVVLTPVLKVKFAFLPTDDRERDTTVLTTTQLLHVSLPFCEDIPTVAVIDIYRAEEGDCLRPGCLFTLFHVINIEERIFGEFYLTDECTLDRPLPHVKGEHDEALIKLVNKLLQGGVDGK